VGWGEENTPEFGCHFEGEGLLSWRGTHNDEGVTVGAAEEFGVEGQFLADVAVNVFGLFLDGVAATGTDY